MVSVYSDENSFKFFMYVSANFGLPMGGRTQSYQDVGGAPIHVGHWEGMGGFNKPRTPWHAYSKTIASVNMIYRFPKLYKIKLIV